MRVAFFTDTFEPQVNGVVTSINHFARGLMDAGETVFIFAPDFEGTRPSSEFIYTFPSRNIRIPKALHGFQRMRMRGLREIASQLKKSHVDLIHAHTPGRMGIWAILLSRSSHIPLVCTYHTTLEACVHYLPLPKKLAQSYVRQVSRLALKHHQAVISPSASIRDYLLSIKITTPVSVIPTPIPSGEPRISVTRQQLVQQHKIFPDTKGVLLFAGRLSKEKNFFLLLDVLTELIQHSYCCHLLVAGDGPARKEIEREIEKKQLSDHVSLLGLLSRPQLLGIMDACDLFVFPACTETQGLVILEALSTGTPVLASDEMGAGEIMQDQKGGRALPSIPSCYVQAIISFLSNRGLYERTCQEALQKARMCSVELSCKKLTSLYRSILSPCTC